MIYVIGEKDLGDTLITLKRNRINFQHFPFFSLKFCNELTVPGLYLLDFNLEGASSFKACREIRRINPLNVIYILSNNMDETNIGYAKANGANGVLKKSAAVILQTVSEFLAQNPSEEHQNAHNTLPGSDLNGEFKALKTLATFYLGPIADFMFDEFIQQNLSSGQIVKKVSEQLEGKEKVKFLNEARQFI